MEKSSGTCDGSSQSCARGGGAEKMSGAFKKLLTFSQNLKSIRSSCSVCPGLQEATVDSLQPVRIFLESLFVRLNIKENPCIVFSVFRRDGCLVGHRSDH